MHMLYRWWKGRVLSRPRLRLDVPGTRVKSAPSVPEDEAEDTMTATWDKIDRDFAERQLRRDTGGNYAVTPFGGDTLYGFAAVRIEGIDGTVLGTQQIRVTFRHGCVDALETVRVPIVRQGEIDRVVVALQGIGDVPLPDVAAASYRGYQVEAGNLVRVEAGPKGLANIAPLAGGA